MRWEIGDQVVVQDSFQDDYYYVLSAPIGRAFRADFQPALTPKEMLHMGVFEGKYCNDCQGELPSDWFDGARISDTPNQDLNYFGVKSRQSLAVWKEKGWIVGPDPRGWFQWYCRYYMGRRLEGIDNHQIKRWKAFSRHAGQVRKNCQPADIFCRPRQRQALLQWAYDPFI